MVQGIWSNAVRLVDVYGPTETTVNMVYYHMRPECNISVIRKPLRNTMTDVINGHCQEVPVGSVEQLAIGCAQSARGYTDNALIRMSFPKHRKFNRNSPDRSVFIGLLPTFARIAINRNSGSG